jgi:2-polyprenyl-6-hydroxyphenyl methylase/3-demethylubiquinone-9 3-methyltransferase
MEDDLIIWGFELKQSLIDEDALQYFKNLPKELPDNQWLWSEMNRVWNSFGLDNTKVDHEKLSQYYKHPIWLVNGIFSHVDPLSYQHRVLIASQIQLFGAQRIADFGGGLGELSLSICAKNGVRFVEIIEPYASDLLKWRISKYNNITLLENLNGLYDCIVLQDVLEHVENPVLLIIEIIKNLKSGGFLILANCFYPIIECHLPSTFYLRHTIRFILRILGLKFICKIENAEHAVIYQKTGKSHLILCRYFDLLFKKIGFVLNFMIQKFIDVKNSAI